MKRQSRVILFTVSLVFLCTSVHANLVNKVLVEVRGKGGNVKEAITQAQYKLAQQLKKEHATEYPNMAVKEISIDSHYLTIKKLGRTQDGKHTVITMGLKTENYIALLNRLKFNINQTLNNPTNWQANTRQSINKDLKKLAFFISLTFDSSLENLQQSHYRDYLVLKQKFNKLTKQASITFIGEIEDAHIHINGMDHKNQQKIDNLLPGWHWFHIAKEGFLDIEGRLYLNPGEHRQYFISLIKAKPQKPHIHLKISEQLSAYQSYIEKQFISLGYKLVSSSFPNVLTTEITLHINHRVATNEKEIEQKTYTIEILASQNGVKIFKEDWHQVDHFIDPNKQKYQWSEIDESHQNEQNQVKDVIQKALYYFVANKL